MKYSYFLPKVRKLYNGWAQPHETSQAYLVALIDEIYQKKLKKSEVNRTCKWNTAISSQKCENSTTAGRSRT